MLLKKLFYRRISAIRPAKVGGRSFIHCSAAREEEKENEQEEEEEKEKEEG